MLDLYHSLVSPCAQKVRLVLHEKDLEYRSHVLNIVAKENLSPDYLKLNPQGVVPTLLHEGVPVVESTFICEYLDEVFPEYPMLRGGIHERLRCRFWMKSIDEKLHPALGALAWAISMRRQFLERGESAAIEAINKVPDPVRRSRQLRILVQGFGASDVADAIAVYRDMLGKAEQLLSRQQWVSGSYFGLADAALTPYVHALYQYSIEDVFISQGGHVERWFTDVAARGAFEKAVVAWVPDERLKMLAGHGRDCHKELSELATA